MTSAAGCAWTATSNAPWLTITAGGTGSGNGTVQYSAAATSGGSRSGTLTIGGETFTVTQGSGCTFALAPSSLTLPAGGGSSNVSVTAGTGCAWTATSSTPWLTIASGASGNGSGTVSLNAAANTGVARPHGDHRRPELHRQSAERLQLQRRADDHRDQRAGGNSNVSVTAPAGCTWTASSGVNWVTVASVPAAVGTER